MYGHFPWRELSMFFFFHAVAEDWREVDEAGGVRDLYYEAMAAITPAVVVYENNHVTKHFVSTLAQ